MDRDEAIYYCLYEIIGSLCSYVNIPLKYKKSMLVKLGELNKTFDDAAMRCNIFDKVTEIGYNKTMRVWDLPVDKLCNKHLVAQHHEIHCIYGILTKDSKGYRNHPEVKRWEGRIGSLTGVHDLTVDEMTRRGFNHQSNLPQYAIWFYPESWQSVEEQIELLKSKGCQCKVSGV